MAVGKSVAGVAALVLGIWVPSGCGENQDNSGPQRWVTLSGVAFEFGPSPGPVPGAEISIAEFPEIVTFSDEDGRYVLEVPDGTAITPWAETTGFPRMHLETFNTDGQDLTDVNFQMVPQLFYDMFAGALQTDPDPERCQIATTVNVAEIKGLSLEEFVAFGPHGVAGVTATSEPAIDPASGPVYFSASTIPDRSLTETTIDGGVVWSNVEPGVYTLYAHHPTLQFRPFTATCTPGRFINAGPPWGLHQIAE